MLLRLVILITFCLIMYVIYRVVIKWQLSRVSQFKEVDPILSDLNLSIPTLVYFTTPMCAICRTTQRPAFDRLENIIDPMKIIKVDASEDMESAQRWGVLSVPTTFILDKAGNPTKVNNGFVDENKLSDQIQLAHGKI